MTDLTGAARDFRDLARNLRYIGEEGLRKELYQAISDAADPLVQEIENLPHLQAYMPDRYADVLAKDLKVSVHKRTGTDPGVTVMGRAPTFGRGGRKVAQRDTGIIWHPVFAQGPRRSWRWKLQTAGMRPGYFTGPAERSGPRVREAIIAAIKRIDLKARA